MHKSFSSFLPLLIFIFFNHTLYAQPDDYSAECFMILAGKECSVDGSVLSAHNNDLTGMEASLLEKHPRKYYEGNEKVTFPSGLKIPQVSVTYGWLVLRIWKGFAEGDAAAINEHQVGIVGGVALGSDRNDNAVEFDPLVEAGLTGGVRYIALQRSKSARECVEVLGNLYSTYGITYPSGVGISDTAECWYIETAGGHHWAAVRIPDDSYMIIANGYRIGEIDPSDSANVMVSPGLLEMAAENGLREKGKPLNFAALFGGGRDNRYYDTRRVWRGISLLSPSLSLHPDSLTFPMFCKPDDKLSVSTLISVLRDRYEGTPYCPDAVNGKDDERVICIDRAVHAEVIQLRGWLPNEAGAVLWAAPGNGAVTPFIPFYYGINSIPPFYNKADEEPSDSSAFWRYKNIADIVLPLYQYLAPYVHGEIRELEREIIADQLSVEIAASMTNEEEKNHLPDYLTRKTESYAKDALELQREIYRTLTKNSNK